MEERWGSLSRSRDPLFHCSSDCTKHGHHHTPQTEQFTPSQKQSPDHTNLFAGRDIWRHTDLTLGKSSSTPLLSHLLPLLYVVVDRRPQCTLMAVVQQLIQLIREHLHTQKSIARAILTTHEFKETTKEINPKDCKPAQLATR